MLVGATLSQRQLLEFLFKERWMDDKVVISDILYFHPYLGESPYLTHIFSHGLRPSRRWSIWCFSWRSDKQKTTNTLYIHLFTCERRRFKNWEISFLLNMWILGDSHNKNPWTKIQTEIPHWSWCWEFYLWAILGAPNKWWSMKQNRESLVGYP